MTNYTKTTDFAAKDALPSGNSAKIVKGSEIDTEFNNIATASATKANANDAALTGTTTFETISDGTIAITAFVDEDNMASDSATLVPTQQSVKAYVDSQVTAQDLDFQADSGGALSIDLDSETLTFTGGTGVDTSGSGNAVTFAIDSTVATLTGTQTLTNKTLTSPTLNTPTIGTSFTIGSATITEAELEILDGATVTTAELNVLDGITSTTAELNILDGVTSTAAELNILDGVTSTAAELNILDGVTATTAELNIMDGVTSTTAELNILDGVTATTAELNYVDGVTSNIQTQLDAKAALSGANFTGSIDVTGSVTADGLTIDGDITVNDASPSISFFDTDGTNQRGQVRQVSDRIIVSARNNTAYGSIYFTGQDASTEINRMIIDGPTGDISFYEDTGTTPKMFWDASAESLGIGTSSPDNKLHVYKGASGHSWSFDGGDGFILENSDSVNINIATPSSNSANILFSDADARGQGRIVYDHGSDYMSFYTAGVSNERLRITSSGNVKIGTNTDRFSYLTASTANLQIDGGVVFDAGSGNDAEILNYRTTAMIFGNGGAEDMRISDGNVGIGTSTIHADLHLGAASPHIDIGPSTGNRGKVGFDSNNVYIGSTSGAGEIHFKNNIGSTDAPHSSGDTKMVIDDSGVGIGTDSPEKRLHIFDSTQANQAIRFGNPAATAYGEINYQSAGFEHLYIDAHGTTTGYGNIVFRTGPTPDEAARIDSSGNLLVGTTDTDTQNNNAGSTADNGFAYNIGSGGYLNVARYGGTVAYFNRTSTDGTIADFRKDGTTVGSIGSYSGTRLGIGSASATGILFGGSDALPATSGTTLADDTYSLGNSSYRWDNIYATSGTVNTSDRNEKQDIEELSDAELRVAVACKGLLRKYRWKTRVAAKGDEARIHFGIIAQDLQAAFEAEGLDAGRYGMFINTTWTDEETGEERSRMGVRYSELLAFIIAAI